jgi:hypothetical protein
VPDQGFGSGRKKNYQREVNRDCIQIFPFSDVTFKLPSELLNITAIMA